MYQILVAEDESLERKVLCKTLKKHFGDLAIIHEAKNGREAVEQFLIHRPQVAILDIEMPGVTGLEAARQIRENIERYIREHYNTEISMQSVAKAMNYSDAYFCKLFKQCFKVNFSAWLNEFRVEKAKEMLLQSRMSIREISLACGYTDANYFARVFKRITGKTPSEFRLH